MHQQSPVCRACLKPANSTLPHVVHHSVLDCKQLGAHVQEVLLAGFAAERVEDSP